MDATLMVNAFVVAEWSWFPSFFVAKLMVKSDPASLMIPTVSVTRALLPNAVSDSV